MKIPFVDLNRQFSKIQKEIDAAAKQVFKKGVFVLGENVAKFEEEFASYLGVKYCVGVDSGTSALILALMALGIRKGDEIITAANGYIATIIAISQNQAKPVFVECDDYFNIDADKIEEKITSRTRAIIPVHLCGQPCRMDKIMKLANKYNLYVVEDCAQAHGAEVKIRNPKSEIRNWVKVGTVGDIGCFSFYPTKNLGCYGDGGAVVTNDKKIRDKIRYLRNYGQTKKYYHDYLGFNNRLDELQAAYLRVKLKHLDEWNARRREIAEQYNKLLSKIVITPVEMHGSEHIYHLYVIRSRKRNKLQTLLKKKGITALIHYPRPVYLQKVYKNLGYKKGSFPKTEKFAREILSLPLFPEITDSEIRFVAGSITEFLST